MNINPEHNPSPELDAITAMETCMDSISEILLQPAMKRGELSDEEQELLGIVGTTLKLIAERAKKLEDLEGISNIKKHFRN